MLANSLDPEGDPMPTPAKPTKAQLTLLRALLPGKASYTRWGGKPWTSPPAKARETTIHACAKIGWLRLDYVGNTVNLRLTAMGKRELTHWD